jgi:transposase
MYVRKTKKKYKGKTYTNHLLVESVSTPKGPRQNTICSLGDLRPRPRKEWLKLVHKVEEALAGQEPLFQEQDHEVVDIVNKVRNREARKRTAKGPSDEDLVTIHADQVATECHREGGPVHVGYQFWKRLGFDEILCEVGLSRGARILSCAMVMNRLVHPCSEHAMPNWIRCTALEDILGVGFGALAEDALYRQMDRLYPNRAKIESVLVERERTVFSLNHTVLLYDLTSTYFEGQAKGNPKAKLGYSRDKRPDCKQVVVGIVFNDEGFPLAHEVFEGNVQDRQTLATMLDLLDARVGLKPGQTVVVDRGMAYDENLNEITARRLRYVVAARQPQRDQWLAEFEDATDFDRVMGRRDGRGCEVQVKLRRTDIETHVLCISSGRTEKDRAIRQKKQRKMEADLVKLQHRIRKGRLVKQEKIHQAIGRLKERYPRVARYYHMGYEPSAKELSWEVDEDRRTKAEQLDGSYVLKTDCEEFTADEIWHIYVLLTRAEEAFRAMKSHLAERPIFHQLERRVETHIFLCVLAYHLLVSIEKTLRDKGVHSCWATVREALKTHEVCTVVLPTDKGSVLRIRKGSTPEPQHKELYELLGVPMQIIAPKKTWSDPDRNIVTEKSSN